jgi:hypothetical protein
VTNRRSGPSLAFRLRARFPGYSSLKALYLAVKWALAAPSCPRSRLRQLNNVALSTRVRLGFDLAVALLSLGVPLVSPPGLALRLGKASRRSKSVHSRQPRGCCLPWMFMRCRRCLLGRERAAGAGGPPRRRTDATPCRRGQTAQHRGRRFLSQPFPLRDAAPIDYRRRMTGLCYVPQPAWVAASVPLIQISKHDLADGLLPAFP